MSVRDLSHIFFTRREIAATSSVLVFGVSSIQRLPALSLK